MGFNGPAKANRTGKATANDRVMTPRPLAREIVQAFPIAGKALEPCMGDGAFLDPLAGVVETDWCEVDKGRDFFDYKGKVDWIVTNPPYSIYDRFLAKCFEVADNVVFLVPLSKTLKSIRIERMVDDYGGMRSINILGGGSVAGFPFGFLTGVVHYERGYKGPIHRTWGLRPNFPFPIEEEGGFFEPSVKEPNQSDVEGWPSAPEAGGDAK